MEEQLIKEMEATSRYLEFVNDSLAWLEGYNTNPNIQQWITNQLEMLQARIRCNNHTLTELNRRKDER
jgi:hypothetical protein